MSAKLFNEPEQSERSRHKKSIKRIDDLIMDAEMEAQAEINQKLRSNNTKMLLVVLVVVGLFYVIFSAVQNQTIPVPSFLMDEAQVAQAPATSGPTPKPIPFPITESSPADETSTPDLNQPQDEKLSPLENEVMTMIQKNLGKPAPAAGMGVEPLETSEEEYPADMEPESLGTAEDESLMQGIAPFTPGTETPSTPEKPALTAIPRSKGVITTDSSPSQSNVPRLTEAQSEFFIQVGAFSVKANADRVIKKLTSGGFSPLVQTRTTRSAMYTVFIGGFADQKSPENMISELKNKGLNPLLKKNDNGSYSIILGKEKTKEKAEALKQKFARQGIFTSMKQMKIDMRMFVVRVGGFESNTNALEGQKKLENLGYRGTMIRKKS